MKSLLTRLALAVAATAAMASAGASVVVNFTPASAHIAVGEVTRVDVRISGLGSQVLTAVDLDFFMNASVAYWQQANFTELFYDLGAPDAAYEWTVVSPGQVGIRIWTLLSDDALASLQGDNLLIAAFDFVGKADGNSRFVLGDEPGQRSFIGRNGTALDVAIGSACIAVGSGSCSVPEPASYGLAGLALLAAGAAGRRRRA